MDSVPFLFCEAVCAVPYDLDALIKLSTGNRRCKVWKAAAAEIEERRVTFDHVSIDCVGGVWSYEIWKSEENRETCTFEDLKAIDKRHLRINAICIGLSCVYQAQKATLDEVRELAKYFLPLINMTAISISAKPISIEILAEFLSLYQNSAFGDIASWRCCEEVEEFLKIQLQSHNVHTFIINVPGWSEEMRVSVEQFALRNEFLWVILNADEPRLVLGFEFFQNLFQKPLQQSCRFVGVFDFEFSDLRSFNEEMLVPSDADKIVWRREDGVKITVQITQSRYSVDMEF